MARTLGSATVGIGRFVHNSIKARAVLGADVFPYAPGRISTKLRFSARFCRSANFQNPEPSGMTQKASIPFLLTSSSAI